MDEPLEHSPYGVLEVDPDGTVRRVNDAAGQLLDVQSGAGTPIESLFPDSVEASVPGAFDTPPETERTIEEYYPGLDRWLSVSIVPTDERVFLYLQDVTDSFRDRRQIEQLRGDLDRLTVLNELISDILGELVGATTREEIAETICRRLGETELYEFAWVGERDLGSGDIVVRAAAGETGRTLARIEECLDDTGRVPEQRAIESRDSELVQPLGDDEMVPESVRRAAFADGLQSLLAIPLTYGESVYGLVGVYSADQDAFSERERASFETVGEMAGFAVNAARHRNLLLSDSVVELAVELTDRNVPFVGATSEFDASLAVEGTVVRGETLLCYLGVSGNDPEPVADWLSSADGVALTRLIGEYGDGGTLEVAVEAGTPLGALASRGVTIQSATFEDGSGRIVVELSPEEDVRRIAGSVTHRYDAEVVAKRERSRDITTARELRDELSDRLTDKQENALRTAFFADYFESPRGSSAQEVAESLDITGPTLLHHLRAGQRKLLDEFFETAGEP